jgi:hypothetical protein
MIAVPTLAVGWRDIDTSPQVTRTKRDNFAISGAIREERDPGTQ